ncbi:MULTISPECIES: hypothetical protein, partial [Paraburkholderia]|uniref:hypothetical protein n=1 Tax=Paraburkholderia TaxID=1822464 RepID=UPI002257C37E
MEASYAQLIGECQGVRVKMPGCVGRNIFRPGVLSVAALIHSRGADHVRRRRLTAALAADQVD